MGAIEKLTTTSGRRKADPWWREELGLKTKAQVETRIREIVASYPDGRPLSEEDAVWMDKILRHHYHYAVKSGSGVKHIEVRTNPSWNGPTRGFWFVREEGDIDISWVTALKPGGRPTLKEDVSAAARYEVVPQIHGHHATGPCDSCPLCGQLMWRGIGVHVDHEIPFVDLLVGFLEAHGLTYEDIAIEDLGLEARFADRAIGEAWQAYHQSHAKLRLTHDTCNLSRPRA